MAKGTFTFNYDTDNMQAVLTGTAAMLQEIVQRHQAAPAPVAVVVLPPEPAPTGIAGSFRDYGVFYDFLRGNELLGPKISKTEYDGCDAILSACVRERYPISYAAYALATSYLETAHSMQPITELGGPTYFTRMYDIKGTRPAKAKELGNLTPGDGAKYCGRGYVQLTGKTNYAKATAKLKALGVVVDLVAQPQLALRADVAALVMAIGMKEGWFTSRKLSDDLPASGPATRPQFVASRDIINGTDRQDDVASYAFQFQTGLMQAGYNVGATT